MLGFGDQHASWVAASAESGDTDSMSDQQLASEINRSVIGRLLEELSWVGRSIRHYRDGGRGYENVLVAETLLALDFLPRTAFLGSVIAAATGADDARRAVVNEIEVAELLMLPPEVKLRPSRASYQEQLVVQPDASLSGPGTEVMIEAKRIRQGSFKEEQLAREFVALTRDARGRQPLLFLIIPSCPPVPVAKLGRLSIEAAITARVGDVLARTEGHPMSVDELTALIPSATAWINWGTLATTVQDARDSFVSNDPSVSGTVSRLCSLVANAVQRHS